VGTERNILKALTMDTMHLTDLREWLFSVHLHTLTATGRQLVLVLLGVCVCYVCRNESGNNRLAGQQFSVNVLLTF
jgi:hypothetical protein